jgi:hypothetical protein
MKSFNEFIKGVQPEDIPHYFGGHALGENPQTVHVLGQIIRVMQHHTRTILTLLQHHANILGHKHDPYSYKGAGDLNQFEEKAKLQDLAQGYKLLTTLLGKMPKDEPNRDLALFVRDLNATVTEGRQLTAAFRATIDEEMFDMLKMNYNKMLRLLNEAHSYISGTPYGQDFYNSFGRVQQYPVGWTGWQKRDAVTL